jgi:hypothetical protein
MERYGSYEYPPSDGGRKYLKLVVGARGSEPPTSRFQSQVRQKVKFLLFHELQPPRVGHRANRRRQA